MKKINKKGDIWWLIVAIVVSIAVLSLSLYLYFKLSGKAFNAGDFITNILRFGK
jgi:hypothetical protein